MAVVTVSPKFQVVIPHLIRKSLGIKPGQKIGVIEYRNRIEFIPMKSMREMRGFLRKMNTTIEREADRL